MKLFENKIDIKLKLSFFLLFFLNLSVAFTQNISINPTILNYNINNPGKTETQSINIRNNSELTQAMEIYFGDWIREEDGKHSYYPAGTKPYSCSNWLKLNTNFVELAPGEEKEIIVSMTSPDNAEEFEEMKWSMLFIQSADVRKNLKEVKKGINTQINEIVRLGIHIYQIPSHLSLASAKVVDLQPKSDNPEIYNLQIQNDGQLMLKTNSFLELTNINTGEEFKSQVEECPIFPLGKRIVSLHLPENLPKGKYSMLGILDYGDPNSLEAVERIIEIK